MIGGTAGADNTASHVDVILPCRDEAAALPWVLGRLLPGYRAIVVDNGSTDGTAAVAASLGATVVDEPQPGYGAAVHAGLVAAQADIVAIIDADASLDPAQLPPLIDALKAACLHGTEQALVLGRRVATTRGAMPWHARAGNAAVRRRLASKYGLVLRDLGSVRVAYRQPLLDLGVLDRRFGYPLETLVRAAEAGWSVQELPMDYGLRAAGTKSKVSGSALGSARAARDFMGVLR